MYTLHHYFLCPCSRFIRICLEEKKFKFKLKIENYWDPNTEYLLMNPAGFSPILYQDINKCIYGCICLYVCTYIHSAFIVLVVELHLVIRAEECLVLAGGLQGKLQGKPDGLHHHEAAQDILVEHPQTSVERDPLVGAHDL